jgi:hypothetical protein
MGVDALPHVQHMYKNKLGVYWGLVEKNSPAFELRNSGVCVGLFALGLFVYSHTCSGWFGGGVRRTPGVLCPFP